VNIGYEKVISFFKICLKLNPSNGIANYYLGKFHAKGISVTKNETEAKRYLLKAVERYNKRVRSDENDAVAFYRLAKITELNLIPELNESQAQVYFKKAANIEKCKFYLYRIYQQKALQKSNKLVINVFHAQKPAIAQLENDMKKSLIISKADEPKEKPESKKETLKIAEDNNANRPHIMISYASQTLNNVQVIREALQTLGFKVWIDLQDMREHIYEDMAYGVENSSHVIACVSEFYQNSLCSQKELSYAMRIKKPVIPIIVQEGYDPRGWVGVAISNIKYYKITNEQELQANLPEIIERIDRNKFNELVQSKVCVIS
jgi:male-specific lethal 1